MMRAFCWTFLLVAVVSLPAQADDYPPRKIPDGDSPQERFLKLIERPRVPLDASEMLPAPINQNNESRFEFNSELSQRVPGLQVKKENLSTTTRHPVVIVLHGTGGSKESMKPLLHKLASRGVIAVAIDARYAGDRVKREKGVDAYRSAIYQAWRSGEGFPFLYDTVWDVQRLLDYLETRPDVDPRRIGAIGFSKGGIELYLTAAVDTRIAASVPCIGVQSFDWALQNNAWQSRVSTIQSAVDSAAKDVNQLPISTQFVRRFYRRVVPGIESDFDGPAMLPLTAPRPLLVINGENDDRTPLPGLEQCIAAAREAYTEQNAIERFEFRLQPRTGHAVTPESEQYAIDWLVKQLH